MSARYATRLAIAALATPLAFAAAGCGGDATSTTSGAESGSTRAAGVEEVVDQNPDVAATVCRATKDFEHAEEHSHEEGGHEHSHEEGGPQVAELDMLALDQLGPLAIEADVPPAELLDEFASRC